MKYFGVPERIGNVNEVLILMFLAKTSIVLALTLLNANVDPMFFSPYTPPQVDDEIIVVDVQVIPSAEMYIICVAPDGTNVNIKPSVANPNQVVVTGNVLAIHVNPSSVDVYIVPVDPNGNKHNVDTRSLYCIAAPVAGNAG